MYEKIVIVLLLSGYISTQDVTEIIPHEISSFISTEDPSFNTPSTRQDPSGTMYQHLPDGGQKARQQLVHIFSEPVIIGIIYAVMLGIIITILSIAFCIGQLTKKSSLPAQVASPEDVDPEVL
ncbi:glycophorin-A isoform X2 [Canis lupus baileyi]|uniref:glycophorin-A isoform X2 n=1 Tax=Canis lupus dingo TaxID=286419 RepID=UPI0006B3E9E4|nr:glycophorin-A isoform X2 [Canis lupus dingo]XP_038543075.1 glycophorin-A isoform X1 [Canis lupus familiaris]|eukprot:XP_013974696.1 glycophorin-A isoform X1 [Canis lupus familiaris]